MPCLGGWANAWKGREWVCNVLYLGSIHRAWWSERGRAAAGVHDAGLGGQTNESPKTTAEPPPLFLFCLPVLFSPLVVISLIKWQFWCPGVLKWNDSWEKRRVSSCFPTVSASPRRTLRNHRWSRLIAGNVHKLYLAAAWWKRSTSRVALIPSANILSLANSCTNYLSKLSAKGKCSGLYRSHHIFIIVVSPCTCTWY